MLKCRLIQEESRAAGLFTGDFFAGGTFRDSDGEHRVFDSLGNDALDKRGAKRVRLSKPAHRLEELALGLGVIPLCV
jgi:hypothetical protein